ncbi:uncharacterized protein CANTADRAFT_8484 [Suhomyces tanzawaensis NRRL Y-17324]|uniref:Uncharacterized protein n=1 Tax=Suhomyces tanzawaensis NRRL Y-17324 TaxID=984487 RepID=A0A1E4SBK4_9ASCO|nr:uncharacterized protein CANTADRAFT_8484 [Suhomyces tanzawaensis NRRL Y-17324]ODV76907.1 hypothetical protein CANTADRAFT_8484 [Suhomyces tanzawaensis NRRL Y-17324]
MMFHSSLPAVTHEYPQFKTHTPQTASRPQEIAPAVWLGSYAALDSSFLADNNIKIIINCSHTTSFLAHLAQALVSSDVIILSLDPAFLAELVAGADQPLVAEFLATHNRVLQNYINHFYIYNPHARNLIHDIPSAKLDFASPILTGNLKLQFFNVLRLVLLCKSINSSIQVLFVSETRSSLATGLATAYLMDTYNYNLAAGLEGVKTRAPAYATDLNHNYYDDLLIIENLKKFGTENASLRQKNPGVLMANCRLKRRGRDDEDEDLEMDTRVVVGDRKRRFRNWS